MNAINSTFQLLACDHVELDKTWNYNNVTSIFYRVFYIESGSGLVFNSELSVPLNPGFIYLIPSFTNCNYRCDSFLNQYYLCLIEESAGGLSLFSANRKIFKIPATEEDVLIIKRIISLNPNRDLTGSYNPKVFEKNKVLSAFVERNKLTLPHRYMETRGLLLQLISPFLATRDFFTKHPKPIVEFIANAIYHIQTHLSTQLTVSSLARMANKSTDYFSRLFLDTTGELPLNYIRVKRVERAKLLLSTTNKSCTDIAMETGFDTLSYFTRTFKKTVGETPSRYRNGLYQRNTTEIKSL